MRRKIILNTLIKILFIGFMFCYNFAIGQSITYPSPAQTITRGLDSTILNVRIDFPACTNPIVTINLGATNNQGVIEYIPNSLVQTGGNGPTIIESNISNLRNPVFAVTTTTTGQFVEFKIKRRAMCGSGASTKDFIVVSGGCSFNEIVSNVNTYNLLAGALTLVPPPTLNNVNLGTAYDRTISVTNGGNGCLDTLGFWIKYDAGTMQFNSLKIGASVIMPFYTSADSNYFRIAGIILSADKLLCNGETVTFTENVTPLKCTANATYGDAWYSHVGDVCEFDIAPSGITMSNNLPNLVADLFTTDPYNYCYSTGETKIQTIRIVNSGAGAASNVSFSLRNYVPGSFTGNVYFDTTSGWQIKKSNGTVLGIVKNFITVSAAPIYGNGCSSSTGLVNYGTAQLTNNIIIPAGDTIFIEVKTVPYYLACNAASYCPDVWGWLGIQTQLDYKGQCGTGSYTEQYKTIAARAYNYFQYTVENPTDISGTAPNNTFSLDLYFSQFRSINNPDNSGSTYFAIPLLGTGLTPNATSVAFKSYTFPITVVNDTMKIGPIPQNIVYEYGPMNIPMKADCSAGGGTKSLNMFVLNKYAACSPTTKIGCKTTNITIHCPDPCPKGGATPLVFSLKRINYGVPDNDENNIPDVGGNIDLTKIKDHHSVNGDTLQANWNIKIYGNTDATDANFGQPINFVYVDFVGSYYGAIGGPATLSPLPNAVVKIYPAGGGAVFNCTVTPTIVGVKIHYEMSTSCRGGAWQPNDSIVFTANFIANNYNAANNNGLNYAGFDLFTTNNEVYSAYTQKTQAQIAPTVGQTYTCDHFNDYTQISRIWNSPYIPSGQVINGCSNNLVSYIRYYTRNQEAASIFPYEYRNFFIPDEMQVQIPPNFKYRPNTAFWDGNYTITNANITQVGDTLYFKNIKNFFTKYGGTIVAGDETDYHYIYFSIDAQCNAISGSYDGGTKTFGIGNVTNTPAIYNHNPSYYPTGGVWNYSAPQPLFSGGGSVLSSNGTASWNVVLQNQSNAVNANNEYFYISPKNGLTNIVVTENGTAVTPDANGFYELGTLAASATRNFVITANSTICSDSMRINSGWGCSGYPTAFSGANCTQGTWVKINSYPSQIQLTVAKQPVILPATSLTLCSSTTAEFVMNSAQAAYADNPNFIVTPPTGLIISSGQIEYPDGSGNWQTITPTLNAGNYIYAIESHSAMNASGLPGTINNPTAPGRSARLRLNIATDCNFISGKKIIVQQQANRPCGGPIPTALGYNDIVRTDPIKITNALDTGSMVFNINTTPNTISCGNSTISGNVIPTQTNTGTTDTVLITLPNGIDYVGNFTGAPNATLLSISVGANGSTIIKLKIASALATSTVINYGFDVKANSNKSCNNYTIITEAERTFPPLVCAGTPCSSPAKAIIGNTQNNLTVSRPSIAITNFTKVSGTYAPGNTVVVNVALANNSTTNAAAAASFMVDFYCSSSNVPFASTAFPNALPASGSSSSNFNVNIANTPTCNAGDILRAVVKPTIASCVCDSVSLQIVGSVLPIKINAFTAKKVGSTTALNFTTENFISNTNCVIERSVDGINFKTIGQVALQNNVDNNFEDANPLMQTKNYYRIKFIEPSGSISYSDIRVVVFMKEEEVNVYPIPSKDKITIELTAAINTKMLFITLYDATGRLVIKTKWNSTSLLQQIDVSALDNGAYFIKLNNDKNYNKVIKFFVQR